MGEKTMLIFLFLHVMSFLVLNLDHFFAFIVYLDIQPSCFLKWHSEACITSTDNGVCEDEQ